MVTFYFKGGITPSVDLYKFVKDNAKTFNTEGLKEPDMPCGTGVVKTKELPNTGTHHSMEVDYTDIYKQRFVVLFKQDLRTNQFYTFVRTA